MANLLTKNIGPLPGGVWLLAVGGGLTFTYFLNKTTAANESSKGDEDVTGVDAYAGYGSGRGYVRVPAPGSGAITLPAGESGVTNPSDTKPQSNQEWRQRAVSELVARGVSPILADTAIAKWFQGSELDQAENAAVELAIRILGIPPDGTPPRQLAEAPAPPSIIPKPLPGPIVAQPVLPQPSPMRPIITLPVRRAVVASRATVFRRSLVGVDTSPAVTATKLAQALQRGTTSDTQNDSYNYQIFTSGKWNQRFNGSMATINRLRGSGVPVRNIVRIS